ncbi:hypothetical protein ABG768_022608 [Culter alburnus]|uniref:Uncharacterized protein n=1 Tax=Culter alburnus TaxID=194366 RepID=A0AAW2AP16_CULAL
MHTYSNALECFVQHSQEEGLLSVSQSYSLFTSGQLVPCVTIKVSGGAWLKIPRRLFQPLFYMLGSLKKHCWKAAMGNSVSQTESPGAALEKTRVRLAPWGTLSVFTFFKLIVLQEDSCLCEALLIVEAST